MHSEANGFSLLVRFVSSLKGLRLDMAAVISLALEDLAILIAVVRGGWSYRTIINSSQILVRAIIDNLILNP
jgi:hypothetical protein